MYSKLSVTVLSIMFLLLPNTSVCRNTVNLPALFHLLNVESASGSKGFTYKAIPGKSTINDFLTMVNTQGNLGYRYIVDLGYGATDRVSLFLKEDSSNSKFTYRALDDATSISGFLSQANNQGSQGFRYIVPLVFNSTSYAIYAKDLSISQTFDYKALALETDISDYIAQANNQGSNKYKILTWLYYAANYTIYVKDSSVNSTFSYKYTVAADSSLSSFMSMVNYEGGKGFLYIGGHLSSPQFCVFIKDNSRHSTFSFSALQANTSSNEDIVQINQQAEKFYHYMWPVYLSGTIRNMYIDLTHCTGVLCDYLGPFVY